MPARDRKANASIFLHHRDVVVRAGQWAQLHSCILVDANHFPENAPGPSCPLQPLPWRSSYASRSFHPPIGPSAIKYQVRFLRHVFIEVQRRLLDAFLRLQCSIKSIK